MGDEQAALLLAEPRVKEVIQPRGTRAATETTKYMFLKKHTSGVEGYSSTLRRVE